MDPKTFHAGFVSIVGKPNAGKSTLMNQFMGEKLAIVTPKAQTTRHRIMGILSGENHQIVYSDTPGLLEPKYKLHEHMMRFVHTSLEDADLILIVVDILDFELPDSWMTRLQQSETTKIVLINKIDLSDQEGVDKVYAYWEQKLPTAKIRAISALTGHGTQNILPEVIESMPIHPAYYDLDEITDKSERFLAAEIVREKIFLQYKEEIPYCCEVKVSSFEDKGTILVIRAEIYVERDSQKGILIGDGGKALKRLGSSARREMEGFFAKKVFLETHVKVDKGWRTNERSLKSFGYDQD